ncbi:class I SAM-dependent methyltransferase [Catellatospora sichuanensis]|uniref:class I SAM-dependent methyltransferase n=1 Tax=Catellatospora sichuanensis TaxID=1969805 RepID=UPI0011823B44|nr:methyltransferase domain-containing protein [Catellatospora sichuanensis]
MRLLDDEALQRSSVVANNSMNRERGLDGVNSYARDLGFHPLEQLRPRLAEHGAAAWLDLCCGQGRALAQAARQAPDGLEMVGVDLVDHFDPQAAGVHGLTLVTASISQWQPDRTFDLITCVHGLHYVGDKLGMLARALTWLSPGGTFAAHLDLASIRLADGTPATRLVRRLLREAGVAYDARRRIVTRTGPAVLDLPLEYAGADDQAGPNYTGQPAVDSYYRPLRTGTRPDPVPPPRRAVAVDDRGVRVAYDDSVFEVEWRDVYRASVSRFVVEIADIDHLELTVDLVYGHHLTVLDSDGGFAAAVAEFARRSGRPAPDLSQLRSGHDDIELWQQDR